MLTGLLKAFISHKIRQSDRLQEERRENAALLAGQHVTSAQIKPLRYESYSESVRLKWFLWGKPFKVWNRKVEWKLSQLPREQFLNSMIMLLVVSYIAFIAWFLYQHAMLITTVNPKAGSSFSFLGLLEFEWGKNKSLKFTGGGAGLYLIAPMQLWISHGLTSRIGR